MRKKIVGKSIFPQALTIQYDLENFTREVYFIQPSAEDDWMLQNIYFQKELIRIPGMKSNCYCECLVRSASVIIFLRNTKDRETPLHRATRMLNLEMIQLLIANRARIRAKDRFGYKPEEIVARLYRDSKNNEVKKKIKAILDCLKFEHVELKKATDFLFDSKLDLKMRYSVMFYFLWHS